MKKVWLLVIGLIVLSTKVHAATISIGTVSADATTAGINDNFQTIANVINGNIEGSSDGGSSVANIKADSVFRINMADDADPATYAKETMQITVDTVSSEGSYVYSGCVPADDTDLTSDISACVAYVNGIRVSKSATSNTYTASRDCYVDLSQTGVYTTTCVANGAGEPSVAANSARLSKVVTDGTEITTITDMRNTRLPGLLVPAHYRTGMVVSRDSTTAVTVLPGTIEINNTMVNKTSTTTLTISTAGDYAGGTSLRAANTYGFVGIDASGNLKLHTTAPTHDNYGVSTTAGKKRYATWSSTVYRILGWFFMDGAQLVEVASNIKDGDVSNTVMTNDATTFTTTSSTFVDAAKVKFYSSGGNVLLHGVVSGDAAASSSFRATLLDGSTDIANSAASSGTDQSSIPAFASWPYLQTNVPQTTHDYKIQVKTDGTSYSFRRRSIVVDEN